MIRGVYEMSEFTLNFIHSFIKTMNDAGNLIKKTLSQDLFAGIDTYLFYNFYTKNEYLCEKLKISRNTSSKYLHQLSEAGILIEEKIGKTKLYKNAFSYNLIKLW